MRLLASADSLSCRLPGVGGVVRLPEIKPAGHAKPAEVIDGLGQGQLPESAGAMLTADGRIPFMWTTERAARHIVRKLRRGKQEIDFPPIYAWVVRLTMFFPARLIMWLTRRRENGGGS